MEQHDFVTQCLYVQRSLPMVPLQTHMLSCWETDQAWETGSSFLSLCEDSAARLCMHSTEDQLT